MQKSATTDSLKVRVESRTLDTDLNNNVFNDTIDPEEPAAEPVPSPQSTQEPLPDDKAAASGDTDGSNDNTDTNSLPEAGEANAGDEGGGGAALYLLMLALGVSLKRRG